MNKTSRLNIPVFDSKELVSLLSESSVLIYLADMLSSFTKIESYTLLLKSRKGIWKKIRFNDMDVKSWLVFVGWWAKNFASGFIKESQTPAFLCWEYSQSTWILPIGIHYPEKSDLTFLESPGSVHPTMHHTAKNSIDWQPIIRRLYRSNCLIPSTRYLRSSSMQKNHWILLPSIICITTEISCSVRRWWLFRVSPNLLSIHFYPNQTGPADFPRLSKSTSPYVRFDRQSP